MTPAENEALLQGVVINDVEVAGSAAWNIPVWVTLVRQNNGYSIHNSDFAPAQLVEGANQYFNNGMAFYFCGVTIVNNSDWYILGTTSSGGVPSEWTDLVNLVNNQNQVQYNKGYINVVLVADLESPGISGIAAAPNGPSRGRIALAGQNSQTLAHELGHFFGIAHPHNGGPTVQDPNYPQFAQYVDNFVVLNGIGYTCYQTGDFVCDTPADPGDDFCNHAGCSTPPCTVSDPLGKTYMPDKSLVMSYYHDCSYRFTGEQNQRMVTLYTGHPDWLFLRDPYLPDCQMIPSDLGLIRRNCKGIFTFGGPAPEITPIEGDNVSLQDVMNQSCGPIPITDNDGRYFTSNCIFPNYNGSGLLSIIPDKDYASFPLNGVSTYDLVLISQHILGQVLFSSPFQWIAADANSSGSITTFDVVEIRKVILGISNNMSAGSWRYVPEYCFENSSFSSAFNNNPFTATWTNPDETNGNVRTYGSGLASPNSDSWMDHVSIDPASTVSKKVEHWSLWGVKTGDVNCNTIVESFSLPPDEVFLTPVHNSISPNQEFILQIRVLGNIPVSAWQLGIEFDEDYLQILEVLQGNSGESFSLDNFGLTQTSNGEFRALNYNPSGASTNLDDKILFKIKVKALQAVTNLGAHFRLKNHVLEHKFYESDGSEIENIDLKLEVASTAIGMSEGVVGKTYSSADSYRLTIYPVPVASNVIFDFFLSKDEEVRLSFFDAVGHLISQNTSFLAKGPNSIKSDVLANKPAGIYWCLFESDGQRLYGKIVKN